MIWERGEREGWGEAVLWQMGMAGGFPSLAVFKAQGMLLKAAFCPSANAVSSSDPVSLEEPAL